MNPLPPPRPSSLPEKMPFPRDTRYHRPRRAVSFWGLLLGLLMGGIGGVFYTWQIAPLPPTETEPRQLSAEHKAYYAVAIALQFGRDGNLGLAVERLISLQLGPDPIQGVAEVACDLARTGYVDSSAGLRSVQSLKTFYQLQGRSGCADILIAEVDGAQVVEINVPTPTPTLPRPATKTPAPNELITPSPAGVVIVPTNPPTRNYEGSIVGTFCDTELTGLIEVFVQAQNGDGIAGERIRVRWDSGQDEFVTGLKPERGAAYADFRMQSGRAYTIEMPSRADPLSRPLVADECITPTGQTAITSYRVLFRRTS